MTDFTFVYFLGAAVVAVVCLIMATWFYFDPDNSHTDKVQRLYVRRYLLGFLSSSIWPLALLGLMLFGLVVLFNYAFPRESEK